MNALIFVYIQGLLSTEKSNYGGGNTKWEEKSLGSYATRYEKMIVKIILIVS